MRYDLDVKRTTALFASALEIDTEPSTEHPHAVENLPVTEPEPLKNKEPRPNAIDIISPPPALENLNKELAPPADDESAKCAGRIEKEGVRGPPSAPGTSCTSSAARQAHHPPHPQAGQRQGRQGDEATLRLARGRQDDATNDALGQSAPYHLWCGRMCCPRVWFCGLLVRLPTTLHTTETQTMQRLTPPIVRLIETV